jgi:hypothetical protein
MFHGYQEGLYLVTQKSIEKGVDHYGILDIGNRTYQPQADGINPVIIHQVKTGLRLDWVQSTGDWKILGKITDEEMALQRLRIAATTPTYNLFGNNCEHFARFVATGKKESTQLQGAVFVIGIVVFMRAILGDD